MQLTSGNRDIEHHAGHSGYGVLAAHLADRVEGTVVVDTPARPSWLPPRAWRRLSRSAGMPGTTSCRSPRVDGARHLYLSGDTRIVHFLWGDQTYRYSAMVTRLPRRIAPKLVCTFHQPPDVLAAYGPPESALRRLDAAVVLSSDQREYFGSLLGEERVFQIPHGIDTTFFCPSDDSATKRTCLVVGQWLERHGDAREGRRRSSRTFARHPATARGRFAGGP